MAWKSVRVPLKFAIPTEAHLTNTASLGLRARREHIQSAILSMFSHDVLFSHLRE